ncbi:DUF2244 domain-containing protein [Rhodoferax sp. OV413]|uniref:DUF2244 domain-containing protein n=1 Tax=Rhodoferax sp. OV413 TaxID=1855285 RepID=UPI0025FB2772|nr:DUF2244 domain-containing protein [Rhodoferax sp. OV413]
MMNSTLRFATIEGNQVRWSLRRNCSVTPLQLMWVFLSLSGVSTGIGFFFWMQGATLVMPFAVLELLALGGAFWMYARHSTDGEHISLEDGRLVVKLECAGKFETAEFQKMWVRVEPVADDSSLIELSERGRTVRVGRYIRPELRPQLAREIRSALRAA